MSCQEFTVTLSTGKNVTAEFEANVFTDNNYGADADGNRGMSMDFVEDIEPTVPYSDPNWLKDDDGNALSEAEKAEAIELLEKLADGAEWEKDEPDYDRDDE